MFRYLSVSTCKHMKAYLLVETLYGVVGVSLQVVKGVVELIGNL